MVKGETRKKHLINKKDKKFESTQVKSPNTQLDSWEWNNTIETKKNIYKT
jgi:hypothetical protein